MRAGALGSEMWWLELQNPQGYESLRFKGFKNRY
jgi:hypothetical protein